MESALRLGFIFCTIVITCYTSLIQARDGNMETVAGNDCMRPCNGENKICEFDFVVEWYHVLSKACYDCPKNLTHCYLNHCVSGDGNDRPVITVNRKLPAPPIQVCVNDMIRATIHNHMSNSEGLSIHWHGQHQRETPYMDGVGSLTQCDIHRHGSFMYEFKAETVGTHFYHGHSGLHRADGLFGALVVRQPKGQDPNQDLYDVDLAEHVIVVSDWMSEPIISKFTDHHYDNGDNKPRSMIINGRGVYSNDTDVGDTYYTPRELFTVEPNKRYRFRVVSNGILNCPIEMTVDSHDMLIIASDGAAIEPIRRSRLIIYAGERFDIVLHTIQQPQLYWIKFAGLADCNVPRLAHARQQAVLRYSNSLISGDEVNKLLTSPPLSYEESLGDGPLLNPLNTKSTPDTLAISELNSTDNDDITLTQKTPDHRYYFATDFYKVDNILFHHPEYYPIQSVQRSHHLYMPQMNGASLKLPSVPPLTQYHDLSPNDIKSLCEADEVLKRNCSNEFCYCTHYLKLQLNKVVEIVLVDEGATFDASHPFHLHGHYFRVVGMKKLGKETSRDEVMRLDGADGTGLPRKLTAAIKKDTVVVPDGGYTILRFYTDNPGFWLLHCHIDFHVEIGMGVVIQVGEIEDMKPIPEGFPTCHNWPRTSSLSGSASTLQIYRLMYAALLLLAINTSKSIF